MDLKINPRWPLFFRTSARNRGSKFPPETERNVKIRRKVKSRWNVAVFTKGGHGLKTCVRRKATSEKEGAFPRSPSCGGEGGGRKATGVPEGNQNKNGHVCGRRKE